MEVEFTHIFFNIILSQVLNIVIGNLSRYILQNMSELIKNKLSDYDFINRFITKKKNHQIIRAYYNLDSGKSIIPSIYTKISNYLKKKSIYKNYKFDGNTINGIIDDKLIRLNSDIYLEIKNILHNEKDIESVVEIYTLINNFDINKFYKKLDKIS
jgi:hypothetical protein